MFRLTARWMTRRTFLWKFWFYLLTRSSTWKTGEKLLELTSVKNCQSSSYNLIMISNTSLKRDFDGPAISRLLLSVFKFSSTFSYSVGLTLFDDNVVSEYQYTILQCESWSWLKKTPHHFPKHSPDTSIFEKFTKCL